MIQVEKDYCHSVTCTIDLTAVSSLLKPVGSEAAPPPHLTLAALDAHLKHYPYASGFTAAPLDRELWIEVAGGMTDGMMRRYGNVRRWAEMMERVPHGR